MLAARSPGVEPPLAQAAAADRRTASPLTPGGDDSGLPVTAISGPTPIQLANASPTPVVLSVGTRLARVNAPLRLYASRGGPYLPGNSILTSGLTGRGTAYVEADRFDY